MIAVSGICSPEVSQAVLGGCIVKSDVGSRNWDQAGELLTRGAIVLCEPKRNLRRGMSR